MAGKNQSDGWGLNDKQKLFCEEYILDFIGNAAAKRAGYLGNNESLRVTASKLLKNPKIQSYIAHLQTGIEREGQITRERVLTEYARLSFSNIKNILSFSNRGVDVKNSLELSDDITASIKEVVANTRVTVEGESYTTIRISLYDKTKALKDLGQYLGLFGEFNQAIACLEKYGLSVFTNAKGEWVVIDKNDNRGKVQYNEIQKELSNLKNTELKAEEQFSNEEE